MYAKVQSDSFPDNLCQRDIQDWPEGLKTITHLRMVRPNQYIDSQECRPWSSNSDCGKYSKHLLFKRSIPAVTPCSLRKPVILVDVLH